MFIMAVLFYYISKLISSRTLKNKKALNSIGEVYLTMGVNRTKTVEIKGDLSELEVLRGYT